MHNNMELMWMALLIALGSAIVLFIILSKKAKDLAEVEPHNVNIAPVLHKVKSNVQKYNVFRDLVIVTILEKLILKLRIWAQKTENKTLHWLEHLRVNYKKQTPSPVFSPEYWDNLKQMAGKKMPKKQSSKGENPNAKLQTSNQALNSKPESKIEEKKPEIQKVQPAPVAQPRPEPQKAQTTPTTQVKTEIKKPEIQKPQTTAPAQPKPEAKKSEVEVPNQVQGKPIQTPAKHEETKNNPQ